MFSKPKRRQQGEAIDSMNVPIVQHIEKPVCSDGLDYHGGGVACLGAMEAAQEMGIDVNVAVVDAAGHLLVFSRMPEAKVSCIQLTINKAFTAACHHMPTSHCSKMPQTTLLALQHSNDFKFVGIGGGMPIVNQEGKVMGAVGVSSGTPEQDEIIASAGVKSLLELMAREAGTGEGHQ